MLVSRLYKWSRCTSPNTGLKPSLKTYLRVCQKSCLAKYTLTTTIDVFAKSGADRMHGKLFMSP